MNTTTDSKRDGPPAAQDLAASFAEIARQSGEQVMQYTQRQMSAGGLVADEMGVAQAFMDLTRHMMQDPMKLAQAQMKLWQDYMLLWQASTLRAFGQSPAPVAAPASGDKRFRHEDWEQNFVFDFVKQSYLIAARHLHGIVASVEGLDEKTKKKADFFTRQYIDALSPTNFVLTNPEVLRETVDSGGQNLVKGLSNLLADIDRGNGQSIRIRMTDPGAFNLGENIANTRGKVVYQNELMQLLQYEPTTEQVLRKPLLIVPPWINKFYILDLREKNSFIKWAVDQGHTVFVISWVNPDVELAHKDFEDYLLEGPVDALEQIHQATGEREVNAMGYCLGGTLLASALGYLAGKGEQRIASATFLTTMIDFSDPGELEVFLDERSIDSLEKKMKRRGYLEGHEMAGTFNMLRANDLIWSFVINNYLLGKVPFPFDLLHWNSDSTRLPAAMHSFYLRNCYVRNVLKDPSGVVFAGVPINLSERQDTGLFPLHHRRPYRAVEIDVQRCPDLRRSGQVRARWVGSHRRCHQSAGREEIRLLDQPEPRAGSRRLARRGDAAFGFVVAGLAEMGGGVGRRQGAGACARFGRARSAGGRPRLLRQTADRPPQPVAG